MSDRKLAMPTPPENVPNVSAPPPPPAILPEVTMVEIKLAVEGEFARRMKQLEADLARLTAELAELRERTRWISVKERLPEHTSQVIGATAKWVDTRMKYINGDWYEWDFDFEDYVITLEPPTHWMPLPSSPEPPEATDD